MFDCPRCDRPVPSDDIRFCIGCGYDLVAGETSPLTAKPPVLTPESTGPVARLIRFRSTGEQHEFRLDRSEIAIGKATHNQIVLDDPTVSASHAIITPAPDGYSILDLASRNGTLVNGERLNNRSRILRHGDRIQVGETILTFRLTDRSEPIQRTPPPSGELRPAAPLTPAASPPANRTIKVTLPPDIRELVEMERRAPDGRKGPVRQKETRGLSGILLNSASRIISTLIGAALTIGLVIYLTRDRQPTGRLPDPGPLASAMTIAAEGVWVDFDTGILGEKLEVSGAASRPGFPGMLLVTDRGSSDLIWMNVESSGTQSGPLVSVPVRLADGGQFVDPEAITYGNSFFYLLTSQSDPVDLRQHQLVRFDFDPINREIRRPVESIGNLRDLLLRSIPELSTTGAAPGSLGGLNAEGLAWDPNNEQLLIGLRSPLIGDQAVLIPVRMPDLRGSFSLENIRFTEPRMIILPLNGQGIRDITFDPQIRNFLILSGPPENRPADNFNLWEWNGRYDGRPRRLLTLDGQHRPEGLTSLTVDGQSYLFITGDGGSYVRLGYREEP
ncbi:MAG: DUF3616 domain-containing protein [Blastocatellia bacterium]